MSKAPSWLDKAAQNTTGNTVGNAAEVGQVRNKPGPKKSMVERKTVGLKFSEKRNKDISNLEDQLKLCGFAITRGRSEAVEVAIRVLLKITENNEGLYEWKEFIEKTIGEEDKDIQNS
ncbi:hypothetical protein LRP52_43560 [Photobacterium sp. ZSDE20]|uniref:hypothetical protein n=1 Tax=Vibrio TaxID=662 RepID=UPI000C825B4D|nr:hypothetical protein [Vibrio lentus]MDD1829050.1 hypothetical protein [Photobacterium sp. ZSDE20]PMM23125.1 hypothetical protein BCT58_14320 [Vibrio lentus]